MKKPVKYIAAVISAAIMLSAIPFSAIAEEEEASENSTVVEDIGEYYNDMSDESPDSEGEAVPFADADDNLFSKGDGSAEKPYEISSASELKILAEEVNKGTDYANKYFDVSNNIGLNGDWTPIGTSEHPFTGTFNGGNRTITLNIDSSSDNVGLFGYNSGTIKNITVEGSVSGRNYVGGIAGYNAGTMENCYNSANVTASGDHVGGVAGYTSAAMENCYNTGDIKSNGNYVGGVTGYNTAALEKCYNTGYSTGNSYVGGISGYNSAALEKCYNTDDVTGSGSYIGGIAGQNSGTITNCYNVSNVTGQNDVGGVSGKNDGTISYCYNIGKITGTSNSGSIAGDKGNSSVTNCFYLTGTALSGIGSGAEDASSAVGISVTNFADLNTFSGWDMSIWEIGKDANSNNTRPILKNNRELNIASLDPWAAFRGEGTAASPYLINNIDELKIFRNYVNTGSTGKDKYFLLNDNITMNSSENWTPIGIYIKDDVRHSVPFEGIFDGGEHMIIGLNIDADNVNGTGFFGYNSGTVKNLGIVGGTVKGIDAVGGIVGFNSGTIERCYNTANVDGRDRTGGIVGQNVAPGIVHICYNEGNITATGWGSAGGIVGDSGSIVKNCYNTGNIEGSTAVGGIVGFHSNSALGTGSISNCHNVGTIKGNNYVGGVVGADNGTTKHCYYREGCNADGTVFTTGLNDVRPNDEFESGAVTYDLYHYSELGEESHVWGQDLGDDMHPVFKGKPVIKITFADEDGNTIDEKYINPGAVSKDKFPALKKDGYELSWSTSADGDEPYDFKTELTGDTTFYARFTEKKTIKITFLDENGDILCEKYVEPGVLSEEDFPDSEEFPSLKKDGYELSWSTSADGNEPYDFKTELTGDTTFYARFTKKQETSETPVTTEPPTTSPANTNNTASSGNSGDKSREDVSSSAKIFGEGELLDDPGIKIAGIVMIVPVCLAAAAVLKKRSKAKR